MSKPTAKHAQTGLSGLREEWHNVRWQRLRTTKQAPGALVLTGRVLAFTAAWAIAFVLCDVALAALMHI